MVGEHTQVELVVSAKLLKYITPSVRDNEIAYDMHDGVWKFINIMHGTQDFSQ